MNIMDQGKVVKILMLEDSPEDVLLIQHVIRRQNMMFEASVIDNKEDYLDELQNFNPDVVLSDHNLPQFSSPEALALCRKSFPFMPFILVTGAVSEEFAASIIKEGADDYVLKNNLKRLPTAITQAIDNQHTRRLYNESASNLQSIFGHTDTSFVLINSDLKIKSFNKQLNAMVMREMGVTAVEGENVFSIVRHDHRHQYQKILESILQGTIADYNFDQEYGHFRWYHFRVGPVKDGLGKITGVIVSINDISERVMSERELLSAHDEMAGLIENANAPIVGVDLNLRINIWNKVAEKLSGYAREEVFGKSIISEFIRNSYQEKFQRIFNTVLDGEPIDNLEVPFLTRDHRELILLLNATPRKNGKSELTGLLIMGQNITELSDYRTNLEAMVEARTQELSIALQKEKRLVELKNKFVSMASHEFRTPLSTIQFAAESARVYYEKLSDSQIKNKLVKIEDQVGHLTSLLEDILTVGKSDTVKIRVERKMLDLNEFVKGIIEEVNITTQSARIKYHFSGNVIEANLDEKLFRNILINLLTNAIKFSKSETNVRLAVTGSSPNIMIEVEDKGIGIAEEELDTVFEAFHRGANVSDIQGTGLGLSITRKAVDLLNGTIRVESTLNQGTRFAVFIPAA